MGQQQLLLLVLGIVIVGLAVVAGINAFDENQRKSAEDAITNEGFRLASQAKAWYGKPSQYGGGANDADMLANLSWSKIGVEDTTDQGAYTTPWGEVSMTAATGSVTFDLHVANETDPFGSVTFNPSNDQEIQFAEAQ